MKNIFVGNLSYDSTEDSVRALFEPYGVVTSARVMTDRETGRSRGFAFVEMENEVEADRAIQALNGAKMEGRALNVNEARPKPERSFGAGSRFGGGGGGRSAEGRSGLRSAGAGRREPRW
jgi:cold-inducible RNA-binding protein